MVLSLSLAALLQAAAVEHADPRCGTSGQARDLAALIMRHESQQRAELQCNELLAEIAAERAAQLARQLKPGGLTPNEILTRRGFRFASFYPPSGNQVEAVAREAATPEVALDYLLDSYQHRDHVLGTGEFFSRQSQIGVGYYEDEGGKTQYVVLIAEPYTSPRIVIKPQFDDPETITVDGCPRTWRSSKNEELRKVCRERWLERRAGN